MSIKAFSWGMMQWIEEGHKGLGVSFAKMTVRAGCQTDLHFHDNAHELIYVEEGEVIIEMAGASKDNSDLMQKKTLKTGEKLSLQARRVHRIINEGSASAELSIVYTSHDRHYTAV